MIEDEVIDIVQEAIGNMLDPDADLKWDLELLYGLEWESIYDGIRFEREFFAL